MKEHGDGVGRRGEEEAAAEELRMEHERCGEVVAVERRGGNYKPSGKPEEEWDARGEHVEWAPGGAEEVARRRRRREDPRGRGG
jgi:hypothetical protein